MPIGWSGQRIAANNRVGRGVDHAQRLPNGRHQIQPPAVAGERHAVRVPGNSERLVTTNGNGFAGFACPATRPIARATISAHTNERVHAAHNLVDVRHRPFSRYSVLPMNLARFDQLGPRRTVGPRGRSPPAAHKGFVPSPCRDRQRRRTRRATDAAEPVRFFPRRCSSNSFNAPAGVVVRQKHLAEQLPRRSQGPGVTALLSVRSSSFGRAARRTRASSFRPSANVFQASATFPGFRPAQPSSSPWPSSAHRATPRAFRRPARQPPAVRCGRTRLPWRNSVMASFCGNFVGCGSSAAASAHAPRSRA